MKAIQVTFGSTLKAMVGVIAFAAVSAELSASTFNGNLGTTHNYLTQGAVGTGWEGVALDTGGVSAWKSASGVLSVTNAGGNVETGNWGTTGAPFMWKTVTGDFTNTVQVSGIQVQEWNTAGLAIVDPASGDYVTCALFGLPYYASAPVLSCWNGVSGTTPFNIDGETGPNNEFNGSYSGPYWLRLVRLSGTITGFISTNGTDWDALDYGGPISGTITDSSVPVQVGLFSATYSSYQCGVQFTDYSLDAAGFDSIPAPVNNATGLALVPNPDGSVSASWTAASGSAGSLVVIHQGSTVTYQPVSGYAYASSNVFGFGQDLGGGNFVAYSDSGSSVTISNLLAGSFAVAVYPYSVTSGTNGYNLNGAVAGAFVATPPVTSLDFTLALTNLNLRPIPTGSGSQATVIANYPYASQDVTTGYGVVYASSAPSVATVDTNGWVAAHAFGDTQITATFGGITATQEVHVVAPSYTVDTNDIFCSVVTEGLPPYGSTVPIWTNQVPADGSAFYSFVAPTVTKLAGIAYEKNVRTAGNGLVLSNAATSTGYDFPPSGGAFLNPISCDGASVVAVVKPFTAGATDPYHAVFCVFNDQLMLSVHDSDNQLQVSRNGTRYNTGVIIPNDQTTVVSLVISNDGSFKAFTNAVLAYSTTALSPLTQLTPGANYYQKGITIGRANQYDGWSSYNGDIGDVYFYTNALSDDSRMALEDRLFSKFILAATNGYTITASAGANGAVTPAGSSFVLQGYGQTYTFTPNSGYIVGSVTVDGVSVGTPSSYSFVNVNANHSLAVSFTPAVYYTITPSAGAGGTISPNVASNYLGTTSPTFSFAANVGYQITNVFVDGMPQGQISSYTFPPLGSAHTISVGFGPIGIPVPNSDQLLLAAVTDGFAHSNGAAIGNQWATLVPSSGPSPTNMTVTGGAAPAVTIIGGVNYFNSDRNAGSAGYQYYPGTGYTNTIPSSGASIVAVVEHVTGPASDSWDTVLSMFSGRFGLGVDNDSGQITVQRNSIGNAGTPTGCYLPEGQLTVVSLVMQTNGNYLVYTNGVGAVTNTSSSPLALTPGSGVDWQQRILVGRKNQYDGWTTFNGALGDVFLYSTALSDASRQVLESYLMNKFIFSATNQWTVTASASAGGSISPSGATTVVQGNNTDLSYAVYPDPGYYLAEVAVDGVPMGPVSSYTFRAVNANHTIAATFGAGTGPSLAATLNPNTSGLTITWAYQGWILQSQTNSTPVGISTNWTDVPNSQNATSLQLPISSSGSGFYRLRAP